MDSWFPGGTTLTLPDFLIVSLLIMAMLAAAYWSGREEGQEETLEDFFLAKRRVPSWAAALSFVSSEVNAMFLLGVPALAYLNGWRYLQFFLGAAAARVVIARIFLPAFYRLDGASIYEFMERRFGAWSRRVAAAFFFMTRLFGSGARLMVGCVAVAALLGWHLGPAILLLTAISVACIGFGGVRACVWTGALQVFVLAAAGLSALLLIGHGVQGGWSTAWSAQSAGRLGVWTPYLFGAIMLNGFVTTLAACGTDQEQMQRLMTAASPRESRRAMILSVGISLVVLVLYLLIGTGLYVYHFQHQELPLPREADKIYPHFIAQSMPVGMRGFVLASVFLAAANLPLLSMATSFVKDFYQPLIKPGAQERHYLLVCRVSVAAFGLALAAMAYALSFSGHALQLSLKIGGCTFGPLLGMFLLGLFGKRCPDKLLVSVASGVASLILIALVFAEMHGLAWGWSRFVFLGTLATFGLGWNLGSLSTLRRIFHQILRSN